jgi:hypothetical protein
MQSIKERALMDNRFPSLSRPTSIMKIIFLTIAIFSVLVTYIVNAPSVGLFPNETLRYTASNSRLGEIYCLALRRSLFHHTNTNKTDWLNTPHLTLGRTLTQIEENTLELSGSLAYSSTNQTIFLTDNLAPNDFSFLNRLTDAKPAAIKSFEARAARMDFSCKDTHDDSGITDGYWATKGTGLIHHWSHLYESGFSDGKSIRGQYGKLLPTLAYSLMSFTSTPGPTMFAQISWAIFAISAIAYTLLIFRLYRDKPLLATALITIKAACFTAITSYVLLLAPGFHWYRELVIVAIAWLSINALKPRISPSGKRLAIFGCLAGAMFCYLLESTFTSVAILSAILATAIMHIKNFKTKVIPLSLTLPIIFAIAIGAAIVIYCNTNLLKYVWFTATSLDHGLYHFDLTELGIVSLVILVSLLSFVYAYVRDRSFLLLFFAITTIATSFYYITTPDQFHYVKSIEYSLPLLATIIISATSRTAIQANIRSAFASIAIIASIVIISVHLSSQPAEWELRIHTSDGQSVFSEVRPIVIHGRALNAEMSHTLENHLAAFPNTWSHDYLVSPFDKYIVFTYDQHNGFEDPDFTSWLDSRSRVALITQKLLNTKQLTRIILDDESLDTAPEAAVSSLHTILGSDAFASQLNLRERINLYDVYKALRSHCKELQSRNEWRLVQCGAGGN